MIQGFIFDNKTGKLEDLIAKCCYIPGTVYNNDEYEYPESVSNIKIYGETIIGSNDNENKFEIKVLNVDSKMFKDLYLMVLLIMKYKIVRMEMY